jgi:purine-cytosine permease-like protein
MRRLRQLWDRIPRLARGLGLIALVAVVVVVLSLEPVVATVGGLLSIAFFLAIAFFLFLLWRERRGDLEAWSDWNRRVFYAAFILAAVAIGMAIGLGVPGQDAFALVVVLAACVFVVVRVWRLEHRYDT